MSDGKPFTITFHSAGKAETLKGCSLPMVWYADEVQVERLVAGICANCRTPLLVVWLESWGEPTNPWYCSNDCACGVPKR